ncbi:hypothetical protein ACWA5Z_04210 [Testudinibacter sp. P80/BLE/0925]|uniref:hypothetical protein n=1 Tax=Testudinibacter sp. TW-1 TaxID=3417757 RepID=UPI003D35A7C6
MKVGNSNFYFEINEMELKQKLVPLQIVISGNVLGTLDDTTYLPSLLSSLELILKETYYYDESINCNNYKSRFFLNGDFCSGYRITLEDSFDDFIKRCARNDKKVFSLGNLMMMLFLTMKRLMEMMFFSSIDLVDFISILEKLKEWYRNNVGEY